MYRILVAGAGYTGSKIAHFFAEKKQKVWALTRTATRHQEFKSAGIEPITADLTRPETLQGIPPAHFIVLCPAPDEGSVENYRNIYLDGIRNFLQTLDGKIKPYLILYLSSTAVWRERAGGWVDETVLPDAETEKGKILIAAERQILHCGYPAVIFRLSGIYGPGRNRLKGLSEPEMKPFENGWMNMIHVEDIAAAIPILFKKAKAGEVYTGVDDRPVLRSEFYGEISKLAGVSWDSRFFGGEGGKRCSNTKLKSLGMTFRFPTFIEGYKNFLKNAQA